MLEQRGGHVAEDHVTGLAHGRDRAEGEQPVARSDVEDSIAFVHCRVHKNPIADGFEESKRPSFLVGVAGVASRQNPICPPIRRGSILHPSIFAAPSPTSRAVRFRRCRPPLPPAHRGGRSRRPPRRSPPPSRTPCPSPPDLASPAPRTSR